MYTTFTYRPWRRVDVTVFQEAIRSTVLCTAVDGVRHDDADQQLTHVEYLAALYDGVITAIADRLAPLKTVTRRHRP